MTNDTRKVSVRLDARLHGKLEELVEIHPRGSMTAVIDQMITTGLSPSSTFLPHIYLQAAVANLAAILTRLRLDGRVEADDLALARHFYGLLLEMTIDIEGVEP